MNTTGINAGAARGDDSPAIVNGENNPRGCGMSVAHAMTPSRHSTVAAGWGRNPFLDPDSPASAAARMAAEIGDRHNLESHTTAAHDAWGRPWVAVEFAARYAVCCPSQTVKPGWVGLRPSPHDGSPYHDGTGDAQCPGCGSRGVGLAMSGAAVLDPGDLRSQLETLAAAALRRAAEAQL